MAIGMLDHSAGIASPPAPSSSSSTRASCSVASASGRSTTSSSRPASCVSGWRRTAAAVRGRGDGQSRARDDRRRARDRRACSRGSVRCWTSRTCATSDGAFTEVEPFASVTERADAVMEPWRAVPRAFLRHRVREPERRRAPVLREGTLRAEPLAEALSRIDRPATVISESPDEESHQAIREILLATANRR